MASLQTLAERQRSEEEVRSQPRTLVLAHERTLGTLTIRHDDAKVLVRGGLLYECGAHDLHLVEYREWDIDDVERILIALARASKVVPIRPMGHGSVAQAPLSLAELKKRVVPVYDPDPLSVGEIVVAEVKVAPIWFFAGYAVLASLFVIAVGAYFGFTV